MHTRHIVLRTPQYEVRELVAVVTVDPQTSDYVFPLPLEARWELTAELWPSPLLYEHDRVGDYQVRVECDGTPQLFDGDGKRIVDHRWFYEPTADPTEYRGEPTALSFGSRVPLHPVACSPEVLQLLLRYLDRGYLGPIYLRRMRSDGYTQELLYADPVGGRERFCQPRGYAEVAFTAVVQVDPLYGGRSDQAAEFDRIVSEIEASAPTVA